MDTPCVKICTMEEDTGLCAGCWRTLDEIMAWPSLSPAERRGIMAGLEARRGAEINRCAVPRHTASAGATP